MIATLVYAQSVQPVSSAASPYTKIIIQMALIMGILYFVVIKPKKEQDKFMEMLNSLSKNDAIVTSSGIHGTIVNVKETTFVIRVDEGVKLEIDKSAVTRKKEKKEKQIKQ